MQIDIPVLQFARLAEHGCTMPLNREGPGKAACTTILRGCNFQAPWKYLCTFEFGQQAASRLTIFTQRRLDRPGGVFFSSSSKV